MRFGDATRPWFTVVGVVGDVHVRGARGESRAETYLPYWQLPEPGTNIVLKTAGKAAAAAAPLRQAVQEVDPNLPVARVMPMTSIVERSIEQPRFVTMLVGLFAGLALSLAAVGIYGVIAFTRRAADAGDRRPHRARRQPPRGPALVVGEGLMLAIVGVVVGVGLAVIAGSGIEDAALRRRATRSGDVRRSRSRLDRHCGRGLAAAGAARRPRRSDGGAEVGIAPRPVNQAAGL